VNRIVPQIIKYGHVIQPGLGVVVWPDYVTRRLGLPAVLVREVNAGGAAERAGLRGTELTRSGDVREIGDMIFAIDDKPTRSQHELLDVLTTYQVGDTVTVRYRRGEDMREAKIELQPIE
jgi:S1-C subfamily serine protease